MTPFKLAMPDECKIYGDAISSYRKYYIDFKSGFAKWKYRTTPIWYSNVIIGS